MNSTRRTVLWHLRAVAAAVALALGGVLVTLWVRSHAFEDRASGHLDAIGVRFYSSRGWLVCAKNTEPGAAEKYPWQLELGAAYWIAPDDDRLRFQGPLAFVRGGAYAWASMPHWALVAAAALTAFLLKPRPRFRLSVAELLIIMTVATITMACVTGVVRLAT